MSSLPLDDSHAALVPAGQQYPVCSGELSPLGAPGSAKS
jgi:hypothetical protein